MVACQEISETAIHPKGPQALHDLARTRAPVDQVAEEHQRRPAGRPGVQVGLDRTQQPVKQVNPAVNVPDRVSTLAVWCAGGRPFLPLPAEHAHF